MNVKELLFRSAQFYAKQEAIIDGDRRISFSEAWDRGVRFANGMLSMGLNPQDRVGVLEDNCLESADVYIGLAIANLVRVPLYAGSSLEVHKHMLGHTGCSMLVVSSNYIEEISGIEENTGALKSIIVRDENYEEWLYSQSNKIPKINIAPDDLFIIRHSGGTSGLPKGIGISHKNWISSMRDWFFPLPPIVRNDSFLHISPMSHASGYMFLPVWAAGGRNIMLSTYEPDKCLKLMDKENVNYIFVPPSELDGLVQCAASQCLDNWSNLKALMSGGASIPSKVIQNIRETFGDVLYLSYGQTEVGIVSIGSPSQWKMKNIEGSNPVSACGIPLHFVDIKIMDGDEVLTYGQPGEIVVHTDNMMDHYWGHVGEKHKGWVRTGDMGKLDQNGFLYILGRKEDVIVSKDIKIFPLELENIISSHPEVLEVAVVGIPNAQFGQVIVIYCVVKENSVLENQEIQAICQRELNNETLPINVKITMEKLPRSNVGKVVRNMLPLSEFFDSEDNK